MVKLEEVEDEELEKAQPGPISEDEDDDFVDTDSSLSSSTDLDNDDDDDALGRTSTSESLTDRLLALRDMLSPQTRRSISSSLSRTSSMAKSLGLTAGKVMWVVSTSTVLVIVPFALAYVEEAQIVEQEKEMKAQERLQNEMTPGVGGAGEAKAAGV